jgi:hypothetical protein
MSCSDEVFMNMWWVNGPFFVIISHNVIFVCLIEVNEKMSLVLIILKTIEKSFKMHLQFWRAPKFLVWPKKGPKNWICGIG